MNDSFENYTRPVTKKELETIVKLPIIKNFPSEKPIGLDIDSFPSVFPMNKPNK